MAAYIEITPVSRPSSEPVSKPAHDPRRHAGVPAEIELCSG